MDPLGEWLNDKMHGKGTSNRINGETYKGDWFQGEIYGKGTKIFANGDKYIGTENVYSNF
jgi:hypothetical protein